MAERNITQNGRNETRVTALLVLANFIPLRQCRCTCGDEGDDILEVDSEVFNLRCVNLEEQEYFCLLRELEPGNA